MGGGGKGGGGSGDWARRQEQQKQQGIREGTRRIDDIFNNQFNDDFYKERRQSYLDYANPQLEDQYNDAKKELTYSLARSGLIDSSVRGQKAAEAQKIYDQRAQEIADKGLEYETDARNSVEGARGDLVRMLQGSGDANAAASGALARSKALSQAPAYSPLGQLFYDFTVSLGKQAARDRADNAARGISGYGNGLFGIPTGTVRNG